VLTEKSTSFFLAIATMLLPAILSPFSVLAYFGQMLLSMGEMFLMFPLFIIAT
jgi:hypothetical protein